MSGSTRGTSLRKSSSDAGDFLRLSDVASRNRARDIGAGGSSQEGGDERKSELHFDLLKKSVVVFNFCVVKTVYCFCRDLFVKNVCIFYVNCG